MFLSYLFINRDNNKGECNDDMKRVVKSEIGEMLELYYRGIINETYNKGEYTEVLEERCWIGVVRLQRLAKSGVL